MKIERKERKLVAYNTLKSGELFEYLTPNGYLVFMKISDDYNHLEHPRTENSYAVEVRDGRVWIFSSTARVTPLDGKVVIDAS